MKIKNVWEDIESPLELHTDDRGSIADIFYNEFFKHYLNKYNYKYLNIIN